MEPGYFQLSLNSTGPFSSQYPRNILAKISLLADTHDLLRTCYEHPRDEVTRMLRGKRVPWNSGFILRRDISRHLRADCIGTAQYFYSADLSNNQITSTRHNNATVVNVVQTGGGRARETVHVTYDRSHMSRWSHINYADALSRHTANWKHCAFLSAYSPVYTGVSSGIALRATGDRALWRLS